MADGVRRGNWPFANEASTRTDPFSFHCQECGKVVSSAEQHTFEDCREFLDAALTEGDES